MAAILISMVHQRLVGQLEVAEDNRAHMIPVTAMDLNRDHQPFKADQAAAAVVDLHRRIQTLRKVTDQVLMLDPEVQLERILVHPAVFRRHIQVQTLHKVKDQE